MMDFEREVHSMARRGMGKRKKEKWWGEGCGEGIYQLSVNLFFLSPISDPEFQHWPFNVGSFEGVGREFVPASLRGTPDVTSLILHMF